MNNKESFHIVPFVAILLVLLLSACQPQPVIETVIETVTVKETVVKEVPGESIIQTVEVVKEVTPTPVPEEVELVFGDLPRNETFIVGHNDVATGPKLTIFNVGGEAGNGYASVVPEGAFYRTGGKVYPWLAQKWEYNADGTQMKLFLTPGVNYNDGTLVTMEDWFFTFDSMTANIDKGAPNTFRDVTYEKDDDNVILFKFFKPADEEAGIEPLTVPTANWNFVQYFIGYTANVWPRPKHIWEGEDFMTFPNNPPVGTGPYKLKSCNPDTATCIWERRDDYWNEDLLPKPQYVVFTNIGPEDVAFNDALEGNYDLLSFRTGTLRGQLVKQNRDWATAMGTDYCPRVVMFNFAVKPFDDSEFRRAMSLLINRELAGKADQPASYPMIVPWPYLGQPDPKFYDPALVDQYDVGKYDPLKAADILDTAGYTLDANGRRLGKDGKPISIEVWSYDVGAWGAWPRLFAAEAIQLGIDVKLKLLTDFATFIGEVQEGKFGMSHAWVCARPDYPVVAYSLLRSTLQLPVGTKAPWPSISRYNNPAMDALLDEIDVTNPSDPAAVDLLKQAYQILVQDRPYVPDFGALNEFVTYGKYWKQIPDGAYVYTGFEFLFMLLEASGIQPEALP